MGFIMSTNYLKYIKYAGISMCALAVIAGIVLDEAFSLWLSKGLMYLGIILCASQSAIRTYIEESKKNESIELVDKGKEKNYYRLSYRRRCIRTLPIVIAILALCIIDIVSRPHKADTSLLWIMLIFVLVQLGYNLYKWKTQ